MIKQPGIRHLQEQNWVSVIDLSSGKWWFIALAIIALCCVIYFLFRWFNNRLENPALKHAAVYGGIAVAVFVLVGLLTIVETYQSRMIYAILSSLFLLVGIIHCGCLCRYKEINETTSVSETTSSKKNFWPEIMFTVLVVCIGGAAFVISVLLAASIQEKEVYLSAFMPFALPLFSYLAYLRWQNLPEIYPKGWHYNPGYTPPPLPGRSGYDRYGFELKVYVSILGTDSLEIDIDIHPDYKVGDTFHLIIEQERFITDRKNKAGELAPMDWYFSRFRKNIRKRYYIDPGVSFRANGIRNKSAIEVSDIP